MLIEAVEKVYTEACVRFRDAMLNGDRGKSATYRNVCDCIEKAWPEWVKEFRDKHRP